MWGPLLVVNCRRAALAYLLSLIPTLTDAFRLNFPFTLLTYPLCSLTL
jgi:hypothetical protein